MTPPRVSPRSFSHPEILDVNLGASLGGERAPRFVAGMEGGYSWLNSHFGINGFVLFREEEGPRHPEGGSPVTSFYGLKPLLPLAVDSGDFGVVFRLGTPLGFRSHPEFGTDFILGGSGEILFGVFEGEDRTIFLNVLGLGFTTYVAPWNETHRADYFLTANVNVIGLMALMARAIFSGYNPPD